MVINPVPGSEVDDDDPVSESDVVSRSDRLLPVLPEDLDPEEVLLEVLLPVDPVVLLLEELVVPLEVVDLDEVVVPVVPEVVLLVVEVPVVVVDLVVVPLEDDEVVLLTADV